MRNPFTAAASGFTSLEILIVLAILGIAAAMVIPVADTTLEADDLEIAAVSAADALRTAQSAAMSGRNARRWGVHFQADRFVTFEGGTYGPADPGNEVHELGGRVKVSAVSLTPGGSCNAATGSGNCDVHFTDAGGQPNESGTVTFINDSGETRTVTVNTEGMVQHD